MITEFEYKELWPVTIMKSKLDVPHEEIEEYTRKHLDGHKDYTSYFDKEFNDVMVRAAPHREVLKKELLLLCRSYCRNVRKMQFSNDDVKWWYSVYKEGDNHCVHSHPNCKLAGTYYPYADSESSRIQFRSPYLWAHNIDSEVKSELWFHQHNPTTGDVLIWPSWLEHEVPPQKQLGRPRVAISFNYTAGQDWREVSG